MSKRKSISKSSRFEVFKRDSFTCQYCGATAPDVLLEVDHINPVANGGDNSILNLITACRDCNSGKGKKTLSDKSAIEKQKQQLDALNEKRQQLKMMIEWKEELEKIDSESIDAIERAIFDGTGRQFTEQGRLYVSTWIEKYGFSLVWESAETARKQYLKIGQDGNADIESANKAFEYIPRIAFCKKAQEKQPYLKDLYYLRAVVRNTMYCNERVCTQLLGDAFKAGFSTEALKEIVFNSNNWTHFRAQMEELLQA